MPTGADFGLHFRTGCRNRQAEAFYDVVNWFKPSFVLMENVCDILRAEDGIYAKSAIGCLLEMRYQVRMGIIAACDQGVPQARNRQVVVHSVPDGMSVNTPRCVCTKIVLA